MSNRDAPANAEELNNLKEDVNYWNLKVSFPNPLTETSLLLEL
jgi:hypothetical protein